MTRIILTIVGHVTIAACWYLIGCWREQVRECDRAIRAADRTRGLESFMRECIRDAQTVDLRDQR